MKKLFLLLFLAPMMAPGQVIDNFSDGNFSVNPAWTGDTTQFEVNLSNQLQLQSSGTDTSILLTRSGRTVNTEWSFWMKLSFNTSSNNNARIYLLSDSANLKCANAIFLQVGGSDDSIAIIKQNGIELRSLYKLRSYKTDNSTNIMRFKIIRDDQGAWETYIDTTGGFNYIPDGGFSETSIFQSRWFGVYCRYTSSNAAKFWFDDFYVGAIIHDIMPPQVISQEIISENNIKIALSEPIQKQEAENPANFRLFSDGYPDSAKLDVNDPTIIILSFPGIFPEGAIDTLLVHGISDLNGNLIRDTLVPVFYYTPQAFDIVINEVLADPDPPVELPVAEFVELYNRTVYPLNLKDWTFQCGSYSKVFPVVTIPPKGYLIISKDSVFLHFGLCTTLFTSSSSLSNEGTTLALMDQQKHIIHSVSYNPEWFGGSFKGDGGWSLEMSDPANPCGCMENWSASTDYTGGTPGRKNSNIRSNPDITKPLISRAFIADSSTLKISFSEAMDSLTLLSQENWIVNPEKMGLPESVEPEAPRFDAVKLHFSNKFTRGVLYNLSIAGKITDCAGNQIDSSRNVRFAIPDSVAFHDVVINEFLPDPATGGSRFTELYNRSDKILDLQSLVIAVSDAASLQADAEPLTDNGYLLFPGDYVAFTSNPAEIISRYRPQFPEAIMGMEKFPTLGNDSGTVIIARKDNFAVIDRVRYDAAMHYPILATTEGVSLERASPELPSDDRNNWHSAAETVGFATPGYQNSHQLYPANDGLDISVTPEVFSPDNDGFDDLLSIAIREPNPGFSVNIYIYDSRGRAIKQVANQVYAGNEGFFCWDGTTGANRKAGIGIYVLLIEVTRQDGTVKKVKKTTVLGGKLSQ
ncbi:MAG: lamin tail domain-containing protein [Bacteroidetes bacterium]|nr:lamin tail domain-containing protein [Bacteroidota bacterium]